MENLKKLLIKKGYEITDLSSGAFSVAKQNVKFTTIQKNGRMSITFFKQDINIFDRLLEVIFLTAIGITLTDDEKSLNTTIDKLIKLFENKEFKEFLKNSLDYECLKNPKFGEIEKDGIKYVCREGMKFDEFIIKEVSGGLYQKQGCKFNKNIAWLDVGANVGAFGMRYFNESSLILMYEPEEVNCKIIKESIKRNNAINCKVIQAAVIGGKETTVDFYVGKSPYAHSMKSSSTKRKITVQAENINDILAKYPMINALKLDCEGAEYEIIKNLSKSSWKQLDQLVCEFHFNILGDVKIGKKWNEIMSIVKKNFKKVDAIEDIKSNWNTVFYCSK